jgi:hypothetical protein
LLYWYRITTEFKLSSLYIKSFSNDKNEYWRTGSVMVDMQHADLRRFVDITNRFGVQLDDLPVPKCNTGRVHVD